MVRSGPAAAHPKVVVMLHPDHHCRQLPRRDGQFHRTGRSVAPGPPAPARPADPPEYRFVLDETVLRRPVGGHEVMRAQPGHLIAAPGSPRSPSCATS